VAVGLLTMPGAVLLVALLDTLFVVRLIMLLVAQLDKLFVGLLVMLPVALLDRLFVVRLVMLPVALLRGLFVRLLMTLTVPLLFTWPSAPMSRSAIQAKISRDENRLEKYCISCAPLCKEIVSRKEERIMTRALFCQMNGLFYHRRQVENNRIYCREYPLPAAIISCSMGKDRKGRIVHGWPFSPGKPFCRGKSEGAKNVPILFSA